jgi:hypothetical protein
MKCRFYELPLALASGQVQTKRLKPNKIHKSFIRLALAKAVTNKNSFF